MHPLTREKAVAFSRQVADDVAAGSVRCWSPAMPAAFAVPCSWSLTFRKTSRTVPISRRCWCTAGPRRTGLGAALAASRGVNGTRLRQDTAGPRRRHRGRRRADVRAAGLGARGRHPRLRPVAARRIVQHDSVLPVTLADSVARIEKRPRILGSLQGVATGDAIGKQTETLSREAVVRSYRMGFEGSRECGSAPSRGMSGTRDASG